MEYTQLEKKVRLVHVNWDEECKTDLLIGRGFPVTESILSKDREEKLYGGIASQRFATDWDDDQAFAERYSCRCKALKGRVHEGETCDKCGTVVEYRDVDISMTAWIMLKGNYVIHPIFYKMIESLIGKKTLPGILEYNQDMDQNGQERSTEKPAHPYVGIGMYQFRERFEEIVSYFLARHKKDKKKVKEDVALMLLYNKDAVFTSCIPVYTSVMRDVNITHENIHHDPINSRYSTIYELSNLLTNAEARKASRRKVARKDDSEILFAIQKELTGVGPEPKNGRKKKNPAWDEIFQEINSKYGHIRSEILGGQINFSARNVIIPDVNLKADEIRLGYTTFLELYKYQIIHLLTKINDWTPYEAHDMWFRSSVTYNEQMFQLMSYMVDTLNLKVFINRNPTINYGSLLTMKIVSVKKTTGGDYTMSLPIQILPSLNADFDGDVLNIVALMTKELQREFDKGFNPRKTMYISRNDGLFNSNFNLFKDQIIGLSEFNNI